MTISWQADRKSYSSDTNARYEISFGMAVCGGPDGDSRNPHLLTEPYLQLMINEPSKSLHQFMKVTVLPSPVLFLLQTFAQNSRRLSGHKTYY